MSALSKSEKRELKSLFEEVIEEKIGVLEAEISGIKSTMTAQYLSSIGRMLEREAKETIEDFACSYHPATEQNCKSSLKHWIGQYTNRQFIVGLLAIIASKNKSCEDY